MLSHFISVLKPMIKGMLLVMSGLFHALAHGHLAGYLKLLGKNLKDQADQFVFKFGPQAKEVGNLESPSLQKLEQRVRGLHRLLPDSPSYSILIPVYQPDPRHFRTAVKSALR